METVSVFDTPTPFVMFEMLSHKLDNQLVVQYLGEGETPDTFKGVVVKSRNPRSLNESRNDFVRHWFHNCL